jgi:hypothetical protein
VVDGAFTAHGRAEVLLGSPRVPTDNADMELFDVLRVPVLHGALPDAGDPVLALLRRAPALTHEAANHVLHGGELPGVTPGNAKALMANFRSLAALARAEERQLAILMGPANAARLWGFLHKKVPLAELQA